MAMPRFEVDDFILEPTIIAAFTEKGVRVRCFKFLVEHFGCDKDDHDPMLYALVRPRGNVDRWLFGAEQVGGDDQAFINAVRARALDRRPSEDFQKLCAIFGRPWSLVVKNPVPVILHQEQAIGTMPGAWKILLRDRTLAEIDKAVVDADLDEDADWNDPVEWPVLRLLAERFGDAYLEGDDLL